VDKLTDFGTTLAYRQHYCRDCRTVFEAIKWGDADDSPPFFIDEDSPDSPTSMS
jgi:hypothetical protein